MMCPSCGEVLHWFGDNMCDEVYGCECEVGLVGNYVCSSEFCPVSMVSITSDCEGCVFGPN